MEQAAGKAGGAVSKCVTCHGAGWVLAETEAGKAITRCYTCQRAGRQTAQPPRVFALIPEQLHPLLRKATAGALGSVELAPGQVLIKAGQAALEYATAYAMEGNPECLERLEEIRAALERTPAEPEPKLERTYDVTGLTFRPCRTCKTPIAFAATDHGRHTPVETSGLIHWPNCPGAQKWRKTA